jgi:hypothetical protein
MMNNKKTIQIRNSTAEFLIFSKQAGEDGIEVRISDGTVWLTQKRNIFDTGEFVETSVCREFRHTAKDGKEYTTKFYNLDATRRI